MPAQIVSAVPPGLCFMVDVFPSAEVLSYHHSSLTGRKCPDIRFVF